MISSGQALKRSRRARTALRWSCGFFPGLPTPVAPSDNFLAQSAGMLASQKRSAAVFIAAAAPENARVPREPVQKPANTRRGISNRVSTCASMGASPGASTGLFRRGLRRGETDWIAFPHGSHTLFRPVHLHFSAPKMSLCRSLRTASSLIAQRLDGCALHDAAPADEPPVLVDPPNYTLPDILWGMSNAAQAGGVRETKQFP